MADNPARAARQARKKAAIMQRIYNKAVAEMDATSIDRPHWDYNPRCYNPDGVKVSVVYGAYSNFR